VIRVAFVVAMLAACGGKKDDKPAEPAGSGSAVATPGSGSAPAGSGSAAAGSGSGSAVAAGSGSAASADGPIDVPTEVDFEDTATTKITEKNLDTELKTIEAELGQ
jgi:hypothetical protein